MFAGVLGANYGGHIGPDGSFNDAAMYKGETWRTIKTQKVLSSADLRQVADKAANLAWVKRALKDVSIEYDEEDLSVVSLEHVNRFLSSYSATA